MSEITRESVLANMQEAADRMGLDLEDLQEMIVEVLEDCSGKTQLLKAAIESKDVVSVKSIAHDIKGSTANYGLKATSSIAYEIEKNNEHASIELVDQLIHHFDMFSKMELDKD